VLKIIEEWVEDYFFDFANNADLLANLKTFISGTVAPLGPPPAFIGGMGSHYKKGNRYYISIFLPPASHSFRC